ncbi:MAG: hypothetical protein HEQ32_00595 [Vampirovibrio sp.]
MKKIVAPLAVVVNLVTPMVTHAVPKPSMVHPPELSICQLNIPTKHGVVSTPITKTPVTQKRCEQVADTFTNAFAHEDDFFAKWYQITGTIKPVPKTQRDNAVPKQPMAQTLQPGICYLNISKYGDVRIPVTETAVTQTRCDQKADTAINSFVEQGIFFDGYDQITGTVKPVPLSTVPVKTPLKTVPYNPSHAIISNSKLFSPVFTGTKI